MYAKKWVVTLGKMRTDDPSQVKSSCKIRGKNKKLFDDFNDGEIEEEDENSSSDAEHKSYLDGTNLF